MIKKYYLRQLSLILVMSVSLFSCTIQKRSFNRGYHIEWKSKINSESKESVGSEVLSLSEKNIVANENDIIHVVKESDSTTIENKTNPLEKSEQLNKKPIGLKSSLSLPDTIVKVVSPIRYKKKVYYIDAKKVSKFKDDLFLTRLLEGLIFVVLFYIGAFLLFLTLELNFPIYLFIIGALLLLILTFLIFYSIEKGINNRKLNFITEQTNAIKLKKSESKIENQTTTNKRFLIALLSIIGVLALTLILFY
ncbi:MAG: hypothetical protein ACK46Y_02590 [Fluviicola sp.]|jgi:hypothetical protein